MDINDLSGLLSEFGNAEYGEFRFHERLANVIALRKGELEAASSGIYTGVGVRAIAGGRWGFTATSRLDRKEVVSAVRAAVDAARAQAGGHGKQVVLAPAKPAQGKFVSGERDSFRNHPIEERLDLVRSIEARARRVSPLIQSASCRFVELRDRKLICTTDGARAEIEDVKGAFSLLAVARDGNNVSEASETVGCTGGWLDLFRYRTAEQVMEMTTSRALRLLKADFPRGERATVILDPGIVGLIAHEAIGHTVEADLVMAGATTKDRIGTRVASELVTLADSGPPVYGEGAGGVVLVDDEGVVTGRTVVIENGILRSYLHSRETAHIFGVAPTGNARAYEYSDSPLIRMRNTYIEPGTSNVEEMIAGVKRGYLLKGSGGGQADVNGEFMFGVQEAFKIEDGKLGVPLRGVTISGKAFEVLSTVDAVSDKFEWGLGGGMCGKGQPARVDAGGGYVRCTATVGGRQ